MMRKMFRAWAFLTIVTASVPVLAQQAETGVLDDPQLIAARELLQAGRAESWSTSKGRDLLSPMLRRPMSL